jgi:hypothetical protein
MSIYQGWTHRKALRALAGASKCRIMRRVGGGARNDGGSVTHARVGYRMTTVFVSELPLSADGRR